MAAPEYTLFVAPYLEGWADGEEGNTPITADILNENYDAFLLALNEWAAAMGLAVESAVVDANYVHTDNNYTTTEKNKLSGVEDNANNYSLPTASTSTLGGVKVDGITITIANGVISAVGGGGTDVEGNPSGTPTAVLSSIRIGNDIFSIPGGGGGGSSVSFTQILATGTKIGTITIDGVPTDIYAPTPPTKTSDLTNDSNFVSDASYVHTDNNYTTTEKNKLADLNQVEANPSSGTSAGDLTSIEIDGTKYNIPSGGGGGTTVVANPSGAATDTLTKLQVGNDIYSVSGSGSQEITPISNTDYANLTPQQKSNGQVYLVSPTSNFSPDYTASNWQFASEYASAYAASIDDGKLVFKILGGGGDYNSYACAMYKTGIDLTDIDHITVIANITYIGSPREIQIGVIDTLPSGSIYNPTFNSYETLTEGSWTLPIDKTIELDTSELTGTYYFGIKARGKTAFTAESILFYFDNSNIPNEIYHMNKKFSQYPGTAGGSGHTILDDTGTALAQENNLQFKGVYSHDDSTNGKTIVEVTRSMTSAEYLLLTEPEKKGVIVIIDEEPAPVGSTDIIGTLAAGETSITLSSPAITPDSSIEPWTDTYGVVPTNMEVIQSSSVLDKEIVLERYADYTVGMTITIKDGLGEIISTETINGQTQTSYSNPYVIDGYLSVYYDSSNYRWVIKFLKDCEDNGVAKQANDTVYTGYTAAFVTQDIEYFTQGYGVQMTFEARQANLGVKVRVS